MSRQTRALALQGSCKHWGCGWSHRADCPLTSSLPRRAFLNWGHGVFGELSSVAGVCACVSEGDSERTCASARRNSIMEIVW